MNERPAGNDLRCGDRGGPPGIDPCVRDKGHDGQHGYAGVFWPTCTPDLCSQQTVPMIFRWHSPEHCPAAPTTEPAKPSQHKSR